MQAHLTPLQRAKRAEARLSRLEQEAVKVANKLRELPLLGVLPVDRGRIVALADRLAALTASPEGE